MPTPLGSSAAEGPNSVATLPPAEILTWHCVSHTFNDINGLCRFCSKWVIPATQKFLQTFHRIDPRSVSSELLINYLHANRTMLTPAIEDATAAYAARHKLTVPVDITAELTSLDTDTTMPAVTIQIGPRTQPPSPTVPAGQLI